MGIESNSQNRWRTARERARLKARYEIHSKISNVLGGVYQTTDELNVVADDDASQLHVLNTTLRYLQSIIKNDLSSFSIAALARDGPIINGSLPSIQHCGSDLDLTHGVSKKGYSTLPEAQSALSHLLSTDCSWENHCRQVQPSTLAVSKYGRDYVRRRLLPYLQFCQLYGGQITMLEYASLLGRHGIVAQLLLGGFDPTVCGYTSTGQCDVDDEVLHQKAASRRVLGLMHSFNISQGGERAPVIPMAIWSYIVRSVIEMRLNGVIDNADSERCCSICRIQSSCPLLSFGPPCYHTSCESCLWTHLMMHVPNCSLHQKVVTCPVCTTEFEGFQHCKPQDEHKPTTGCAVGNTEDVHKPTLNDVAKESKHDDDTPQLYDQRRLQSFAKFMLLPRTSTELKLLTKKGQAQHAITRSKKIRDPISPSWYHALHPIISKHLSQDVRTDRFFKAVIASPQVVMCYLQTGIDVNIQNEYGQTPLYVACWKGNAAIVQCLLEYGADVSIAANGGGTCWSIAARWGRENVLNILKVHTNQCSGFTTNDLMSEQHITRQSHSSSTPIPNVTILIDPAQDHPGAGSCIVDNALSEHDLEQLTQLSSSLPFCDVSNDGTMSTTDKSQYRPNRSYYCDADQVIQKMLQTCVDAARSKLKLQPGVDSVSETPKMDMHSHPTSVFTHLRFLYYFQKGGLLPPHVDLCRIDDLSGERSTHTFILYLTDCNEGGGTALLQHLNDPKVLAVAKPTKGRALIFPHLCPHQGLEVDSVPKVLLRGEVII
eukprot:scaffold101910_cov84-Cyclotella_meneghiniana.AAC.1